MSQWTRTPPTEPGAYWIRSRDELNSEFIGYIEGKSIGYFYKEVTDYIPHCPEYEYWTTSIIPPPDGGTDAG